MNAQLPSFGKKFGYSNFEIGLAVYIVFALIISICLFIFNQETVQHAFGQHNTAKVSSNGSVTKTPKNDPAPTNYVTQAYQAHDFKVSMKFDPNSYAFVEYTPDFSGSNGKVHPYTGNDEIDIVGNPLNSTNKLIIVVMKLFNPEDFGVIKPMTGPDGVTPLFTTTIMGKPYTIYTDSNPGISVDEVDVIGGNSWYSVKIENYIRGGTNAHTVISQNTAQTTLESLEIR